MPAFAQQHAFFSLPLSQPKCLFAHKHHISKGEQRQVRCETENRRPMAHTQQSRIHMSSPSLLFASALHELTASALFTFSKCFPCLACNVGKHTCYKQAPKATRQPCFSTDDVLSPVLLHAFSLPYHQREEREARAVCEKSWMRRMEEQESRDPDLLNVPNAKCQNAQMPRDSGR